MESCFKVCSCSDIHTKLTELKKLLVLKMEDSYSITLWGHGQLMTIIERSLQVHIS